MEFMPRITRAQSMDILSSQSNLSGYKAVLDAAGEYGRAFPMMMTAAGYGVAPRALFVMGVGVGRIAGDRDGPAAGRAGLRHRRALGDQGADPVARRQADLRRECRGDRGRGIGRLRDRDVGRISEGAGELVSAHIAKQDIVITTALIPGRAAPRLVSDAQIATDARRAR